MIVAICKSCSTIDHSFTTLRCRYCGSEFIEIKVDVLPQQIKHTYNRDIYDPIWKEKNENAK